MRLFIKKDTLTKKKLDIYIFAILIATLNVITVNSRLPAYVVIVLEVLILFYKFIQGNMVDYIVYYLLIFSTSIEFTYFVGMDEFYSIKNMRIAGMNLGIYLLLPLWINFIKVGIRKNVFREYKKIGRWIIIINILAFIVGLFGLLINDNNIQGMESYLNIFVGQVYYFFFIPISIFVGIYSILKEKNLWKINSALQASLIASCVQLIVAYILGLYGNYDGLYTLMSTVLTIFIPFLIMLLFYRNYVDFFGLSLVIGVIGLLLTFRFNASGKLFIITACVLGVIYFVYIKNHKALKGVFFTILAIVAILALIGIVSFLSGYNFVLFSSKLNQVKSLISFWNPDWIQNMDLSPKTRLGEFVNIFIEYGKKPYYIFTGKGYLGNVKDHCGWFYQIPEYMRDTGFPNVQFNNNTFCDMHEISKTILVYGVFGVVLWGKLASICKKNFASNPWIVVGTFWIIVYYGYSFTITVFGSVALFYGLIVSNHINADKIKG